MRVPAPGDLREGRKVTREQKLELHLEMVIFEDLPEGTRLNAEQISVLMDGATMDQVERAYQRALTRSPVLLEDER